MGRLFLGAARAFAVIRPTARTVVVTKRMVVFKM